MQGNQILSVSEGDVKEISFYIFLVTAEVDVTQREFDEMEQTDVTQDIRIC